MQIRGHLSLNLECNLLAFELNIEGQQVQVRLIGARPQREIIKLMLILIHDQ